MKIFNYAGITIQITKTSPERYDGIFQFAGRSYIGWDTTENACKHRLTRALDALGAGRCIHAPRLTSARELLEILRPEAVGTKHSFRGVK